MKHASGSRIPLIKHQKTTTALVLVLCLVLFAGTGASSSSANELQPLDNNALRAVSGEEGLRGELSLESLGRKDRRFGGYTPLYSPFLASDTPLIGDLLLSTLSVQSSEILESLSEEETIPRYVFEYNPQPLFRSNAKDPENTDLFSNNGIDMTTGPIPESIEAFRGL